MNGEYHGAGVQPGGPACPSHAQGRKRHPSTLCWRCRHAAGRQMCSWARELIPVPGWQAEPSFLVETFKGERMTLRSYHVQACPQFEAESPRTKKGGNRR